MAPCPEGTPRPPADLGRGRVAGGRRDGLLGRNDPHRVAPEEGVGQTTAGVVLALQAALGNAFLQSAARRLEVHDPVLVSVPGPLVELVGALEVERRVPLRYTAGGADVEEQL